MGIWRFAGAFIVAQRQSECGSKTAEMHVSQPMAIGVCYVWPVVCLSDCQLICEKLFDRICFMSDFRVCFVNGNKISTFSQSDYNKKYQGNNPKSFIFFDNSNE